MQIQRLSVLPESACGRKQYLRRPDPTHLRTSRSQLLQRLCKLTSRHFPGICISRKKSDLKFSASILDPTMKLSGPCSIITTQQKVARINVSAQASLRSIRKRVFAKFD